MANPSLQIGNSNWAIKEDNLLGYSTAGTRFVPQPITMTRASAGTRVNSSGLVETVELLGSELVSDSDFILTGTQAEETTGTYWTTGTDWSISGGAATLSTASGSSSLSSSNMTVTVGKIYKVTINVSATSTGFRLYDALGVVSYGLSLGENVFYRTPSSPTYTVTPLGLAGATGTISNVSVKEYTANNLARVDYDGTASSLLAEPERTNTLTYSEDFSQWATSGTTPTLTTGQLSPSGEYNATKISGTIGSSLIYLGGSSSSTTATRTIYARTVSGTGTARLMSRHHNVNNLFTLTEDWTRFELTGSDSLGGGDFYIDMRGTQTLSEFIVWGGQSEVGSYATSYIPTDGGTVTRVKDQYEKTGISNLIGTEGVLFVESAIDAIGVQRSLCLSDGSSNNRILLYYDNGGTITMQLKTGGDTYSKTDNTGAVATDFNKIAIRYQENRIDLSVNGATLRTVSGVFSIPTVLSQLNFGAYSSTINPFFGKVKQLQVFKTALTDSELATLTT